SSINEQIDRMRHAATRAILERRDTVIVASVSCIYGIGSVETYSDMTLTLTTRDTINRTKLLARLAGMQKPREEPQVPPGGVPGGGATTQLLTRHPRAAGPPRS